MFELVRWRWVGVWVISGAIGLTASGQAGAPLARLERYEAVVELGKEGEVVGRVKLEVTALRELDHLPLALGRQVQLTVVAPPSPAVRWEGGALRLARALTSGERLAVELAVDGVAQRRLGKEVFCGFWEDPWLPRLPGVSDPSPLTVSFALPKGRRTSWSFASSGATAGLDRDESGFGRLVYRPGVQGLAHCYGRFHPVRELASSTFVALLDRPAERGLPLSASGASASQSGGMARIQDDGQSTGSNSPVARSEWEAYREGRAYVGQGYPADYAAAGGTVSRLPTVASPRASWGNRRPGRQAAFLAQARWSVEWLSQLLGPRQGGRVVLVLGDPVLDAGSGVGLVALPRKEVLDPKAPLRPFRNEAQLYYEVARQWWGLRSAEAAADAGWVDGVPVVLATMLAEADEGPAAAQAIESIVGERLAKVPAGAPAPAREHGARVLWELRARLSQATEPPSDRAFLTLLSKLHERAEQGSLATADLLAVLASLTADGLAVPAELEAWLTSRLASEAPGAVP
jgi:hypothetical protein